MEMMLPGRNLAASQAEKGRPGKVAGESQSCPGDSRTRSWLGTSRPR